MKRNRDAARCSYVFNPTTEINARTAIRNAIRDFDLHKTIKAAFPEKVQLTANKPLALLF
jgi:hypothetical protein